MRSLAIIATGFLLSAGLVISSPVRAEHLPCKVAAENLNRNLESVRGLYPSFEAVGYSFQYGEFGEKSPEDNKYDNCLVKRFGEVSKEYMLEVTREDPEYGGGTTYRLVEKEKMNIRPPL